MAVTSDRDITIQFTGDVEYSQTFSAATNAAGTGDNSLVNLVNGNNTITQPDGAVALTIIKPSDNTVRLWLKGSSGDDGIAISLTDPDSVSLDPDHPGLVIETNGEVTLRLIFS